MPAPLPAPGWVRRIRLPLLPSRASAMLTAAWRQRLTFPMATAKVAHRSHPISLANGLSLFRLGVSPLLLLFLVPSTAARAAVLVLFILGEISDFLDGIAARRKNQVSDFGKLIDPMADAIFHLTLFLIFLTLGLVPGWMVIVLVWREVAVSSLRLMASTDQRLVIAAAKPGKVKANVQALVTLLIMVSFLAAPLDWARIVAYWGTLAAVLASVYSGAFYFVGYRGILAAVYRRSRPSRDDVIPRSAAVPRNRGRNLAASSPSRPDSSLRSE
ncbi:MAG TPA: CDP-diacylglycerol--glycerol-3-phosphate 3-phosphatidyltransferase [Chloroflexota bacterium]